MNNFGGFFHPFISKPEIVRCHTDKYTQSNGHTLTHTYYYDKYNNIIYEHVNEFDANNKIIISKDNYSSLLQIITKSNGKLYFRRTYVDGSFEEWPC